MSRWLIPSTKMSVKYLLNNDLCKKVKIIFSIAFLLLSLNYTIFAQEGNNNKDSVKMGLSLKTSLIWQFLNPLLLNMLKINM